MSASFLWLSCPFLSVLAFLPTASAQARPSARVVRDDAKEIDVNCWPDFVRLRWTGGRFLAIEANRSNSPIVCSADKDVVVTRWPVKIPDLGYLSIADAAGHDNGTTALVGGGFDNNSRIVRFLAHIAASRKETLVTRLDSYVACKAVIVPTGDVWTLGWIADERNYLRRDKVFKRFDAAGRVVGTWAVSAHFRKGLPASVDAPEFASLKASADRVGYLSPGNEYFEFALDGSEITRIPGPPLGKDHRIPVSLAMSQAGQVVIASQNGFKQGDIWMLDRQTKRWTSLDTGGIPPWIELLGFDGDSIWASFAVGGFPRPQILRMKLDLESDR
ncbi:MAG: hypothetical protein SFV18_06660 [Bryobacteraceae bacterium]|nr:hypothetical protein [Bryobacteraceae bacterium]